jgi:anti-anti-sigma factor
MTIVPLPSQPPRRSNALVVTHRHGQRVVCVSGEHDLSTVSGLSADLAEVMRIDESDVVVDLERVVFMDASTVGAFVRARAFLAARGRDLRLQSPSAAARRVLQLCGVACDTAPMPDLHIVPNDAPS